MTSQKLNDVIACFDALRNFFERRGYRPPKSEHARTPMLDNAIHPGRAVQRVDKKLNAKKSLI